jgi:peptidyl-prolyl cis-trans isomerase B (cyclophilin B)
MTMRSRILATAIILMTLMAAMAPQASSAGPTTTGGFDKYPDEKNETSRNATNLTNFVVIKTNWGTIKLGLYGIGAPITVGNFLNLTHEGFFNGIKYHRIIDDFVIQTGDPNSKDNNPYNDGWGGSAETIPLETHEDLIHVDGAAGMARSSEPDSASSQFYICDTPQPHLDGDYAVFGIVVEGMETVRKIAQAETYGMKRPALKDHPVEDIIMESVYEVFVPEDDDKPETPGLFTFKPGVSLGFEFFLVGVAGLIIFIFVIIFMARWRRRMRSAREEVYEVTEIHEVD